MAARGSGGGGVKASAGGGGGGKLALEAVREGEELEGRLPDGFSGSSPDSLLSLSSLSLGEEIGHGAFSKVYRGEFAGATVAVKKMAMTGKDAVKYLETEVALLKYASEGGREREGG